MSSGAQFVEYAGRVHALSPIGGGEHTLCGDAFDNEEFQHQPTKARKVTCPTCAAVILYCKPIRVVK